LIRHIKSSFGADENRNFFIQKINIRIIKSLDFIDESDEQQDQTRLNNKILLFLPV